MVVYGTAKKKRSSGATRSEAYVQEDINGRTLFIP
jgi:hypothetical protein